MREKERSLYKYKKKIKNNNNRIFILEINQGHIVSNSSIDVNIYKYIYF